MPKRVVRILSNEGELLSEREHVIPEYFDEEHGYLLWPTKHYYKGFFDTPLPSNLAMVDRGRLDTLARCMVADTNMLGYRGHGGIRPYDVPGIGCLVGLKERQASRFVARMLRFGVIAKVRIQTEGVQEVQYYLNPLYYFTGKRLSLNLYLLFHRQLDRVLPGWVVGRFGEMRKRQQAAEMH